MPVFSIIVNGKSGVNTIYKSDELYPDSSDLVIDRGPIISPKIKKDTNKADSFEFMILPDHSFYDEFEKKKTYVYVKRDNKYIFRGRVSEIKTDIFRQRTITCEGDLAYLADTVQFPNKETTTQKNTSSTKKHKRNTLYYASGHESGHETGSSSKDTVKMTPKAYFQNVIAVHNGQVNTNGDNARMFTVGSVTVSGANTAENFERTSHQDTSSVISSDLLSVYGGILRTRFENNTTYIDWLDEYTDTTSQEIKFGVNLIDLDQEPPSDDAWSVLLPIGDENTTIASANNGSKFLINQDALNKYGYIVHYHKFNNVKKSDELLSRARKYLNTHAKVFPDNIVVKAIDLQLIGESNDPIELGDKVKVVSTPHGLSTTMACIKMELDIQNPENNSYTIGTILPPDKEKKKESLSEKQNSYSRSSSRGIGNNRNDIEGLMGDMDAASNNINVNAENIAVNALNIAVNAENIAIVAKNIAIAAEQIDVQAQNITVALGNEADDLYGKIEASAEGIKSTFTDNTTGLSSYFSQKAGEITAAISSADGNIQNKISLTESGLTAEFNRKLYGEDGSGGLVGDYKHEISVSERATVERFEATLYGEGGTPDNPKATSFYSRVKTDTASYSIDTFHSELYGGSGYDPSNPKTGTYFDAVYTKTSAYSRDYFKQTLYGDGTASDPQNGTILYGVYEKSASAWKNELWGTGTKDNPASGSILYGTNQEIGARVKQGDIEAGFTITANGIKLFGKEVSLGKYATVESLSATNANITNITNGTTTATKIVATSAKVTTGTFEIGDSSNKNTKLKYHGTEYYSLTVTMPGVTGSFDCLGWRYLNSAYQTSIDLAHSHSVTTNNDGTITIGGSVSTTASGRSFKIADTKAYKDGVSAATNAVTVDSVGLNTTDYTGSGIGTSQNSNTPIWFSSPKTFYARIRANASNGKHREASITIDGTKAYDAGVSSVNVTSVIRNPGHPDTYLGGDDHTTRIHIRAAASNGHTNDENFIVSGASAYSDGVKSVTISSVSGSKNSLLSDKKTVRVNLSATASNSKTGSGTADIDVTDAYDAGVSSVNVTSVIRNPGYPDKYLGGDDHTTRIHIRAAASNGHTNDENFIVSGASAYAAGKADVSIDWMGRPSGYTNDTYVGGTNHVLKVRVTATATNNASKTTDFEVWGNPAYNEGRNSVNLNDVRVTGVTFYGNANPQYAVVTLSLPGAGGTKRCDDNAILVL